MKIAALTVVAFGLLTAGAQAAPCTSAGSGGPYKAKGSIAPLPATVAANRYFPVSVDTEHQPGTLSAFDELGNAFYTTKVAKTITLDDVAAYLTLEEGNKAAVRVEYPDPHGASPAGCSAVLNSPVVTGVAPSASTPVRPSGGDLTIGSSTDKGCYREDAGALTVTVQGLGKTRTAALDMACGDFASHKKLDLSAVTVTPQDGDYVAAARLVFTPKGRTRTATFVVTVKRGAKRLARFRQTTKAKAGAGTSTFKKL